MTDITYRCKCCRAEMRIAVENPVDPGGVPRPQDYPRIRCHQCGGASAPVYYWENARDEKDHFLWEDFFRRWSHCPNAYQCELHDQYAGDCEAGQVMQKCFVSLHRKMELALHFLTEGASPERANQAKSPVPDR